MSVEPSISVDRLRREFGSIVALDDIDLALHGPEIVGLAGPNGSGKTTLLKCLLGLIAPTEGGSTVAGTASLSLTSDDRRRIGYMPQHEAVYRDLTVRENVAFFARLYDVADPGTAVERALGFVDLQERADARIAELSGGMVRRTSLACALVHDPDVLFLDEPTVGLDPELRASMWEAFRQRRSAGALILVSTHYLGEVTNCDRVLFLREGEVLAFDAPGKFLDRTGAETMEGAFLAMLEERRGENTEGSG
jgi:ABC-2 type transport system ATP-binding protein